MANENLPIQEVESRIKLYKVTPYKDAKIYIRQIDHTIFEYLVVWGGEIYTDYAIVTPKPGCDLLTTAEQNTAFQWILIAATTTVDTLRGEQVSGEKKKEAEQILSLLEETGPTVLKDTERQVN